MNALLVLAISIATLGVVFADEEHSVKKERAMAFYKCVACGDEETIAAYEKCEALKPEKGKQFVNECKKKLIPEELSEKSEKRKYLCENPNVIGKIFDCLVTDDNKKQLSDEDITSFKQFKECAKTMYVEHCKPAV